MNQKILVLDAIHSEGLRFLSDFAKIDIKLGISKEQLIESIQDYEGVIIKSGIKLDEQILSRALNLKVIGRAGSGLDNIDMEIAKRMGIQVVAGPEKNAYGVAEYIVMLMLILCRRFPTIQSMAKNGNFQRHLMQGNELGKRIIGLIGLGHIGIRVAQVLKGFGCCIIGYDRSWKRKEEFTNLGGIVEEDLTSLLSTADVISLQLPLNNSTYKLFNTELFSKTKKGLLLVNTSRGAIIDDTALVKALDSGIVAYAALDVIDPEPSFHLSSSEQRFHHVLLNHDKILYTPHVAAQTDETLKNVALEVAKQMKQILIQSGREEHANSL